MLSDSDCDRDWIDIMCVTMRSENGANGVIDALYEETMGHVIKHLYSSGTITRSFPVLTLNDLEQVFEVARFTHEILYQWVWDGSGFAVTARWSQ